MMLAGGLAAASFVAQSAQHTLMPFSLASEALSQQPIVKKVKLADLGRPDCNLLRAGVTQETSSQKKQAIAVFYDSRVGTHSECLAILGVK